jgi:hypothetical protein
VAAVKIALFLCLLAVSAQADKSYEFSSAFNDGNKAAFLDPVPIVSSGVDEDQNDFVFEFGYVPSVSKLKPLFCLRLKDSPDVQCFFVLKDAARGEVEVITMRPRG